jgi:hypothetical protein
MGVWKAIMGLGISLIFLHEFFGWKWGQPLTTFEFLGILGITLLGSFSNEGGK